MVQELRSWGRGQVVSQGGQVLSQGDQEKIQGGQVVSQGDQEESQVWPQ